MSLISNDKTFFKTLFERTGCLLTADGSDDVKISPRGLKNEQISMDLIIGLEIQETGYPHFALSVCL